MSEILQHPPKPQFYRVFLHTMNMLCDYKTHVALFDDRDVAEEVVDGLNALISDSDVPRGSHFDMEVVEVMDVRSVPDTVLSILARWSKPSASNREEG